MALAIWFEHLLREEVVGDQLALARLPHVFQSRITPTLKLRHLAPDIAEALLFLPRTMEGKDPTTERDVRPVAATVDWERQRAVYVKLA